MILEQFSYSHAEGEPQEWKIEPVKLGLITLLVGKNASGKTRTLSVIGSLSKLLSGETKPNYKSGNYSISFKDGSSRYEYDLCYRDSRVESESFIRDGIKLLDRGKGGIGKLFAVKTNDFLEFQTPDAELAAVNRRDSIQHPYFEVLHLWAIGVRHFQFGTPLGKDHFMLVVKNKQRTFDPKDTNAVIAVFQQGEKEFGQKFADAIITDMQNVGYDLEEVGLQTPAAFVIETPPGELLGIFAKEKERPAKTEQAEMSQGMFRALSIIIQLTYSELSDRPSCILIDDIGEGLDFGRSCALIDVIMSKSKGTQVQLLMATNDRFVMNRVPLEHWALIQRDGNLCRIFNDDNSHDKFEEFRFTGMNNFDFFATDFVHTISQ